MAERKRQGPIWSLKLAVVLAAAAIPGGPATPVVVSLATTTSPSAAQPGITVVTLIGSNFPSGTITPTNLSLTLQVASGNSGPSLTVNVLSFSIVTGSTGRISFQVAGPNLSVPTPYQVSVAGMTSAGTTFVSNKPAALTINPPPAIVSLSPNSSLAGQSFPVTVTGQYTNYVQGATQADFGPGISVGGGAEGQFGPMTVTNATTATAQIKIDPAALPGPRTVVVATGVQQASLPVGFTIIAPTLLSVSPSAGQQGQANEAIAITGQFTHFSQGTSQVSFGSDITVNSVTVASATSLTAVITIPPGATVGGHTVAVTTGAESVSLGNSFTVNPGTPALTLVSPNSGQQGQQNIPVTIAGNFTHFSTTPTASVVTFGNPLVTAGPPTAVTPTSLTVAVSIAATAALGPTGVTVTSGTEAVTVNNGFAVNPGTPMLTTVNPNTGQQGQQNLSVSLTGQFTQWLQGTTTASFGAGITVANLTVNSPTNVTVVLNIDPGSATGPRTVTLTTGPEMDSLNNGFTVRGGQLSLAVQPPVSPTFESSQLLTGTLANAIGQSEVTISGGAGGVSQNLANGQAQFDLNVPLKPNAENLLSVTATDTSGQSATAANLRIVQLTLTDIVKAQVSAQRLSATEVQALVANGTINLSNPANFNVSMFSVALTIGQQSSASISVPVIKADGQPFAMGPPMTLTCEAPDQEIQQNGNELMVPCGGGSGVVGNDKPTKIQLIPFEVDVPGTTVSVPGLLLIEGKIKTLKEFFKVNLVLMNTSSEFTVTGISAMLTVPDNGLSPVAPASGAITMDDLAAGTQGTGQFVIRGDVIGVHTVTVNFGGMVGGPLLSTPVPISGSASTQVEVDGPPPLNVTVELPPSVTAGVPYTLKVNIQNTSSILDALYASLELDLSGASILDPTTGLPVVGPSIASLGNILAGQSVSQSYLVTPNDTGPVTSCVGGASQNITLSVVFTNSGLGCAVGTLPSQVVSSSGQPTVAVLPAPNTVNVPVNATIDLLFSDAIQTQTVTTGVSGATFALSDSQGAAVPGSLQFVMLPNGATSAVFKPTAQLASNSVYSVVVSSSIYDVNGMQLASGLTENFTTAPPPPADTTPPLVSLQILPPANAAAVPQGQLLQALVTSSDNSGVVARVDLQLDGQLVDSRIPQSTVTFLVDTSALVPGSSHVLAAVATDPAGNTNQASLNIAITADTIPPTVAISTAATTLQGQTLPVAIQASDNTRVARVDLFVDGGATPVYTGFVAPYQTSLNTALLSTGLHQLKAVATDGAGNVAQAASGLSVISVASISLSPGTITLNGTGATQPLTVTATFTDGSTAPVLSGVGFSSSNTNVAGVDSSGVITSVTPGTATITATFGSVPPAQATVTDIASVATTLALVSGNNQTGTTGQPLSAALVVKITDANSRPVPNVAVTFSVLAGGGTVAQSTVATDSQGLSSTTLTLGPTAGANSATATAGTLAGSPVTFVATGIAGVPGLAPTGTSELFKLNNLSWTPSGSMSIPRGGTTLTVLGDGTVLVLGGINSSSSVFPPLASGEVFSPSTGSWTTTVSLSAPRAFHTQTLLPDGSVLITGGFDARGNPVATAEIYRGPPIQKTTPVLTWPTPASMAHSTPLGSAQLDATANVSGTFTYTPAVGIVLAAGSQTLSVLFTPIDTIHYTTATAVVTITVTP